jgi:hypothetical protein
VPALETGGTAFAWPFSPLRQPWLETSPGISSNAAPCSLPKIAHRRGRRPRRGQWPDRRQSRKRFVTRVRPAPRREACYARARVSFPAMVSRRRVDPEASISNSVCEIAARGVHLCRFSERRSPILFVFDFRVHSYSRRWDGQGTTCAHGSSHAAPRCRTDSAQRSIRLCAIRALNSWSGVRRAVHSHQMRSEGG